MSSMASRYPPPSQLRGGRLADRRFRRAKRSSENSWDGMSPSKRKRVPQDLNDFNLVHQHVLSAAAMILRVTVEKLLSVVDSPASSDNGLEVSSNTSSNDHDHPEHFTPPGSSSSEGTSYVTRSRLVRRPRTHSNEGYGFLPTPGESFSAPIDGFPPKQRIENMDSDASVDLFTAGEHYPTPADSQVGEIVMGDNMWQDQTIPQFSFASYETQPVANLPAGLMPTIANLGDMNDFSFNSYGQDVPFNMDQNFRDLEQLNYPGVTWSMPPPSATSSDIDLFAPDLNPQPEVKPVPKESSAKGRRRGPFRAEEQRQETGLTRKLGACIRCSMQRIRCIPDPSSPQGCCKTCIQASYSRTRWLPCLRYKITDTELLAHEKCPRHTWTTRWKKMELVDITTWASDSIKTIQTTQGSGQMPFSLQVREFKPIEGMDNTCRRWTIDGVEYKYETANYAIADMKQTGLALIEYGKQTLPMVIKHWVNNQDSLLCNTYNMAYKYSLHAEREEDRNLLTSTLWLWAASRRMSQAAHICGEETLGMQRRDFGPKSASTNKILLPPVYSAQMEIIYVTMILLPTKKIILDQLKALVSENNRRSWLAIYLCIFLLLHSTALLTARDQERAKMQGVQRRFYRPRVIDELHNGAKILLAYFHFCNRGSYPLHMDWTSAEQIALSELKPGQIDFMRTNVKEYEKKASHFRHILETDAYEDEFYFIAQLYEKDWKPRHTTV